MYVCASRISTDYIFTDYESTVIEVLNPRKNQQGMWYDSWCTQTVC